MEKRIRVMKEEEDGISSLPDCLLIDIISRLPETKEAIRTSKLSKRWKTLWTEVHNLTFVNSDPEYIDKTLTQCSSQSNLDSFRLRTRVFYKCKWKINNWILYANNRNVQELELFFCDDWLKPNLHQFFFTNSCFTHLKLDGCLLNPTGAISWNKLKSFYISGMELDEDLIQNILSGSPLLETLELRNCYGFRRIDITSKSVKNLVFFADSGYGGGCRMKINAPHIQSLTLKIYVSWCKFLLHDVSTLVKAKLDYCKAKSRLGRWSAGQYQKIIDKEEEEQEQVLKGFMLSLRHVKELIMIGKQCIQVLSRLEAKGFVFPSGLRLQDDSDRFRGN